MKDEDEPEDILKILKGHGFNSIRLRPTSIPPYYPNQAPNICTGNSCFIDTDAQELDVARRARDLGFSLELTLFFDGGISQSIPGSWAGVTQEQLATNIYNYTKAELEMYRKAGLMPNMVSIGNEVDTGFLGGPGFFPFNHFAAFAALEKAGLTAVADAASDTSIGPALPSPLTCSHHARFRHD
jgi:arabinogalactan endo-1,4-beta-galactosidase